MSEWENEREQKREREDISSVILKLPATLPTKFSKAAGNLKQMYTVQVSLEPLAVVSFGFIKKNLCTAPQQTPH